MHYFSSFQVFMGDIKDIKQKCIVIKKQLFISEGLMKCGCYKKIVFYIKT